MSIEADLRTLFADIEQVSELKGADINAYYDRYAFGPPSLPVGDGRQINLSDTGAKAVSQIAATIRANSAHLAAAYSEDEMLKLTRWNIATLLLADTDPQGQSFEVPTETRPFKRRLSASILEDASKLRPAETHVFGAWVFSDKAFAPVSIGPVWLGPRETWLYEAQIGVSLSMADRDRIARRWRGEKLRKRKKRKEYTFLGEEDILATVGDCPWVCTVQIGGHASERSREKAKLAARIALAAIALCWQYPAKAAARMGLLIDGAGWRRISFAHDDDGPVGVWRERIVRMGAVIFGDDARTFHRDHEHSFAIVGDALRAFLAVRPSGPDAELHARLCRALTWFWEACNAAHDFMAITQFAAAMDVLCDGQDEHAVRGVLERCGGFSRDDVLLKDGTTVEKLMSEVYARGRSQFLHGGRPTLVEDLAVPRVRAEVLAALVLKSYIAWMDPRAEPVHAICGSNGAEPESRDAEAGDGRGNI